jgi:hypothetical protein
VSLVGWIPPTLRPGFAVLALGLVLDLAYHLAVPDAAHGHALPLAALLIHAVVFLGMAVSLGGTLHGRTSDDRVGAFG